ncbi:WXG100 family type VII secretion target [Micromonospora sp. WMMD998]|uniref:WXG100-like domain-containing protein n=1 Tax=Micromonospora sp. WMMD998 TaxID=3016092 RepID=UPI00249AE199|nr:WXG100 family type VII secretion target [Micromonospora sp. WMMD998]WFE40280.1 WXG100 family type VII secretion target [Micromonospora sp. WMMD998]
MTTNPLVAGAADTGPSAWAGIWICEDIELITQGVRAGSWIDGSLGVVSAGLDALALVSDPASALLQYGIAWLIEHVKPLSEALDWLAGDPAEITAHAQTWRNVAVSLREDAADLAHAVRTEAAGWTGAAGTGYRRWASEQQQAVTGLAQGAEAMAAITEGAAGLVAAVRLLVRDAVAACVSRLIVYAAELLASAGLATPLVVEQVTTTVASWGARIARLLRGLLASLRRLMPEVRRLGDLIERLKQALSRLRRSAETPNGGSTGPRDSGSAPRPADFDPGKQPGPLGDEFRPGVEDPRGLFEPKERAIADRLADDGAMVHPRERVDDAHKLKNPDGMVRFGPSDPGVVTEFKTLVGTGSTSVRRNILEAGEQTGADGVAVLDGRNVGLSEEDARRGYSRAVGQARVHGQQMPAAVRVILGDDRILDLP